MKTADELKKNGILAEWQADKKGHRFEVSIDITKLCDRFRPKKICEACGCEVRHPHSVYVGRDDIRRCFECHAKYLKNH